MPRASKRKINKNLEKELENQFSFLISSLRSDIDIGKFFEDFLTEEEKVMFNKRLMLHIMLEKGYVMSEIKNVLSMSYDTVRIHRNSWKKGGKTYKSVLQKIIKREKTKEFWKKVDSIIKPFELALDSQTNMKSRAKLLNRDY